MRSQVRWPVVIVTGDRMGGTDFEWGDSASPVDIYSTPRRALSSPDYHRRMTNHTHRETLPRSAVRALDRYMEFDWTEKSRMRLAVVHLTMCDRHEGEHPFAVTDHGTRLWTDLDGYLCIADVLLK